MDVRVADDGGHIMVPSGTLQMHCCLYCGDQYDSADSDSDLPHLFCSLECEEEHTDMLNDEDDEEESWG